MILRISVLSKEDPISGAGCPIQDVMRENVFWKVTIANIN